MKMKAMHSIEPSLPSISAFIVDEMGNGAAADERLHPEVRQAHKVGGPEALLRSQQPPVLAQPGRPICSSR